jgi:hypothetical protein
MSCINKKHHHEALLIVLQLVPYVAYLYLLESTFNKIPVADSFRYLWHEGSLVAFITNSSLSVRLIYWLLGNNIELICSAQLLVVAISQIAIYRCIRNGILSRDITLAALLTLLFSSYHSRWLFNFVMSDSLSASLYLLFIVVICLGDDKNTIKEKVFAISIIFLFIFSRNTAPYIALVAAIGVFLLKMIFKKKSYVVTAFAISLSFMAITTTNIFDTSTQLNAAQNIIIKIFPDDEKTALFHAKYGMPIGPFIKSCRGGAVNSLCFDYQRIQTGSTYTRTYKVTVDNYGFADWIREKGMQSWQHYLLIHDTVNTFKGLVSGYAYKFSVLFNTSPEEFWGVEYRTLIIPFDPFTMLNGLFISLNFDNVYALSFFIVASLTGYLVTPMKRQFLFSGVLLVSGFALFFLGLYGDIGSERQVYPGILSIYLGQVLVIFFVAQLIIVTITRLIMRIIDNKYMDNH